MSVVNEIQGKLDLISQNKIRTEKDFKLKQAEGNVKIMQRQQN